MTCVRRGEKFAGGLVSKVNGARYYLNILDNGGVLIYRIDPDIPNFRLWHGKLVTGTRITASGIGGTKGDQRIEFADGAVTARTDGGDGDAPPPDALVRDPAVTDERSFWRAYLGKLSKEAKVPGGGADR